MSPSTRHLPGFLLFVLLPVLLRAGEPAAGNIQSPQAPHPLFARVRGLLDIDLPDLDPPGTIKLILHPHVSDLIRRDYLRTDVGLRWALNDSFELSSEAATFLNHGLGGANSGNGIGELHFGSKYLFQEWLRPGWEASASVNFGIPVGRPPVDMTDGLNHYSPEVTVQHHLRRDPRITVFASTGLDFVTASSVAGTIQPNMPRDDSVSFTVGGIYDLGQLKWTLSGTYATTSPLGSTPGQDFYYLRPSLLWYVPRKFTLRSKTQWIVGLGTPMTWGPDGYEFRVTTRLRAEITFRQVLDKVRRTIPLK